MSGATEGYYVGRTLQALEALAIRPLTSGELAEAIGVHQRTARRLLIQLARDAYVERAADHRFRYALTLRLPGLGARALLARLNQDELAGGPG